MSIEINSKALCFGGEQIQFNHWAETLNCSMNVSIYLPPSAKNSKVPVLYWLSGLTCTDENFVQKAGAQRYAAEHGVAIVAPDTSPRGEDVPDDPDGGWDFGLGAGFYVDALQQPWKKNYQMYSYVCRELLGLVEQEFPVTDQRSIFGHSMGGHGALTIGLKNPGLFKSISAFAPICAPTQVAWGEKAFSHYLGADRALWNNYDACWLVKNRDQSLEKPRLLVDQGASDGFLKEQLKPDLLQDACEAVKHPLKLNMRPGYDHSYFFIASFIGEHIAFHSQSLS